MGAQLPGLWDKFVSLVNRAIYGVIDLATGLTLLQVLALFILLWLLVMQYWFRQLGKVVVVIYWIFLVIFCLSIFIWIGYY
jgi:hypothetical protein